MGDIRSDFYDILVCLTRWLMDSIKNDALACSFTKVISPYSFISLEKCFENF